MDRDRLTDDTTTGIIDRSCAADPAERVSRTDQRRASLRGFIYGALNPRWRHFRREADANSTFLDCHPPHLLVVATLVMLLSVVDGLFTVYLINAGLQELNPLLAPFVHDSPGRFALVKVGFTAVGVVTLVLSAHARIWRSVRVSRIFHLLLMAYAGIIAYELHLVQLV